MRINKQEITDRNRLTDEERDYLAAQVRWYLRRTRPDAVGAIPPKSAHPLHDLRAPRAGLTERA